MTPEEMAKTLQFLLEQQSQFAAELQQAQGTIANLREAVLALVTTSRAISDVQTALSEEIRSVSAEQRAAAGIQANAEQRLGVLVERVDQLIAVVQQYLLNQSSSSNLPQ